MPSIEETAQQVFAKRAAHYTTSTAHADAEVLARLVQWAEPGDAWIALDIATGTGHTAFAIASRVQKVIGVDLTTAMLSEARKLQQANAIENVEFTCCDAHHLPFGVGAFNLVTSRRAPHHFSAIDRALREMRRVLQTGGRLLIDDRSVPEDPFIDRAMNQLDRWHDPSHVRQYPPGEWRSLLENAGFHVDKSDLYTKHLPLTSLTKDVPPGEVQKIQQFLRDLPATNQKQLHYTTVNRQPFINHWYVMIAARAI